jgi:hypothetical protein
MEWLILIGVLAFAFGGLGAFIAVQKRRDAYEGLIVGALFGPLGVLVEALLPQGSQKTTGSLQGAQARRNIDEQSVIAEIAARFRATLEESDPSWQRLAYRRKRQILRAVEKQIMNDLGLSPAKFDDYAPEARRAVLGRST